jgi:formylglycine-generating enzyme required for sulfatase activity
MSRGRDVLVAALGVALVGATAHAFRATSSSGAGAERSVTSRTGSARLARAEKRESEMVFVPAGTFITGMDDGEKAHLVQACVAEFGPELEQFCEPMIQDFHFGTGPAPREVFVSAFWIDRHEVTAGEYRACVRRGICDLRALTSGDERYLSDELPMVNVTWENADTYCRWREKRLPTEAEWEKAARGTDGRRWPWGGFDRADGANRGQVEDLAVRSPVLQLTDWAVDGSDGFELAAPPGSLPFGASPYGADDMAGNVSEWVADWYGDKDPTESTGIDPTGAPSGQFKVVRGGSFREPRFFARTYVRLRQPPAERDLTRGFRCARDADAGAW